MARLPRITPTLLDRVVSYVDPVAGARRLHARTVISLATGGYTGARKDRRQTSSWMATAGSADADLLPDLDDLRRRSRDLERNQPLARGAISTVVTNVVGTGLGPRARIDRELLQLSDEEADAWERDAERIWCAWAEGTVKNCDVRGVQNFAALQELAFRAVLASGDVFALKRFKEGPGRALGFCWQLVEGDRVANPNFRADGTALENGNRLVGGVEVDKDAAPVAFHVLKKHPGELRGQGAMRETQRVAAFGPDGRRLVLHLHRPLRPEQTRGEPYLAPVIEPFRQLGNYTEAELTAAVISAAFTVFVRSEDGEGMAPMAPTGETGAKASDEDYKLAAGAILDLAPGEDITIADPKRPNAAFDPFVLAVLRQVGVALELPYEILIKHFTASYSAARAALLEAWKFFRARRRWFAGEFCQPSYEEVLGEAVARGLLAAPGWDDPMIRAAWTACEWIGPPPGQLDPQKEVGAAEARIAALLSTRADETAELTGRDWDDVVAGLAREQRTIAAAELAPAPAAPGAPAAAADPAPNPDQPEQN